MSGRRSAVIVIAFGAGILISLLLPAGFVLFVTALLLIGLGIVCFRRGC